MAVSASRISFICRLRMSIAARRARSWPIVIRTRRTARRCAATGRRHARAARSNPGVRQDPSGEITRWEHEHVLEAVQQRLDENPQAMRVRRETVEHPFGTLKMRMG